MEPKRGAICVSLCESTSTDLWHGMRDSTEVGDLVELRLDCLSNHEKLDAEQITDGLRLSSLPAILTFRPRVHGGFSDADCDTRLAFWKAHGFKLPASLFDVEIDVIERLAPTIKRDFDQFDWNRVICSYHNFESLNADLEQLYERLSSTPARVLKIAVSVTDATECLDLFKLLKRARDEGRAMIAIGMGTAGLMTRILGPSRGAFLTYGGFGGKSTGPGQTSAQQLRTLYRVNEIDEATEIFGLVGTPIGQSLSSYVHNMAFGATSRNAVYVPFDVHNLKPFLTRMIHPRSREIAWNLRGLSVTAPHKSQVLDQLDWIDDDARKIGAVNTIVVDGDLLRGYNTDAEALVQPLVKSIGPLHQARVAIIGAGGVARAALHKLRQHRAVTTVFVRDVQRIGVMAEGFGASCESLSQATFAGYDVVINATPLGTLGASEALAPATAPQLRGARLVYDLVYNPTETQLLREAKDAGCDTLEGLSMFVAQAEEQFKLWTGSAPPAGAMEKAAHDGLLDSAADSGSQEGFG